MLLEPSCAFERACELTNDTYHLAYIYRPTRSTLVTMIDTKAIFVEHFCHILEAIAVAINYCFVWRESSDVRCLLLYISV
jgi:hypothetical protein